MIKCFFEKVSNLNDVEFSKYLTEKVGVACIPISPFYTTPPGDKVIRFCFAKKDETIISAYEILKKALDHKMI
jgi:methionine aminotransferase